MERSVSSNLRKGKKFSRYEIGFIKEYYQSMDYFELAAAIDRTEHSVRNKVSQLKLVHKVPKWTKSEEDWLMKIYIESKGIKNLDLKRVAEALGREDSNVCRKAKSLGLTDDFRKETAGQIKSKSANMLKWMAHNEHPKGMLGKHHSEWTKKIFSEQRKGRKLNLTEKQRAEYSQRAKDNFAKFKGVNSYSRTKSGKRADLKDLFVRSSWEANYARILNNEDKKFLYEPRGFVFKSGHTYYPDFYLQDEKCYVELKGWLDSKRSRW